MRGPFSVSVSRAQNEGFSAYFVHARVRRIERMVLHDGTP
jgi:hypothetical protein